MKNQEENATQVKNKSATFSVFSVLKVKIGLANAFPLALHFEFPIFFSNDLLFPPIVSEKATAPDLPQSRHSPEDACGRRPPDLLIRRQIMLT